MSAAAAHPSNGNPLQFYATAATVIPVFVLAGLYQANVKEIFDPAIRYLGLAVFLAVAVIGEVSALHVLSTRHPTTSAKSGTAIGLEVSGVLLVGAALTDEYAEWAKRQKWPRRHPVAFGLIGLLTLVVFVLLIYRSAELV